MKAIKQLLMMTFAVFALGACSNDDVLPDEGGGGTIVGEEAWLALSLSPSKTRAINAPDQETGKANESKINNVRIILFDGFGSSARVTNVVDIAGSALTDKQTDGFKVSTSAESILVIINPSSQLPVILTGATYGAVNAAIAATVENVIGSTGEDFMMTNASGKLEPQVSGTLATDPFQDAAAGYLKDNHLKPSKTEAEGAPLTLIVDRVVSKVRVYNKYNPNIGVPSKDEDIKLVVTNPFWKLNVTNKRFFPVSQRVETFVGTDIWSDKWNFGSYRIDPNHINPLSPFESDGTTLTAAYKAEYNYFVDEAGVSWNNMTNAVVDPGQEENDPTNIKNPVEYCLENTQDKAGNVHAYTTHAMVKATVYPSYFKLPTVAPAPPSYVESAKTGDWMAIGTGFYTFATLLQWIEAELTAYYEDGVSPSITLAFNDYLSVKSLGPVDITKDIQIGATSAEKAAYAKSNFAAKESDVSNHGADTDDVVTYYKNGLNYYKIMIKHDDKDGSTVINEFGEFGVVRNAVYDININNFNEPGYPTIPPIKVTPDEEEESFLSIKIQINPWTWYSQEEDL